MEPQFHLGDDLNQLERALKELAPIPARVDVAQTMFRAGQASVRRSTLGQRVWPVTSAALALLSMALGALLARPDQSHIVYVPANTTIEGERMPQPAMVVDDGSTKTDKSWSASSPAITEGIARANAGWLNPLSHLRSRDLAMVTSWDATRGDSQRASPVAIAPLCSGDWRGMVGDEGSHPIPHQSDSLLPLDWMHLLHIRGS